MKKAMLFLMSLLLPCMLLTACANGGAAVPKTENPTFVLRLEFDFDNLDPHYVTSTPDIVIANNIYSKLIKFNSAKNEFYGDLAESWDISGDGTVYTFHLRHGPLFHDGSEVKASDVVYSVERLKSIEYQTTFASCVLTDVQAIDDYTVQFTLAEPYLSFLDSLAIRFHIVSKAYCEAGNDLSTAPMGSGPYKFISSTAGYEVVLESFDDYYLGTPEIKNVVARVITDGSAATAAYETGELSYGIASYSAYDTLCDYSNLVMEKKDSFLLYTMAINNTIEPLNNALVRQAINYAINRSALLDSCVEGFGNEAYYFALSSVNYMPDYDKVYQYDVAKAKSLMAEAGYADGFDLTIQIMSDETDAGVLIQSDLSAIGINVTLQTVDASLLVSNMFTLNYEAGILSLGVGDYFDAWRSFVETAGTYNLVGYSKAEVDELLKLAGSALSVEEAENYYAQVLDIIMEDAPYAALYEIGALEVLNTDQFVDKCPLEHDDYLEIFNIGYAK